MACWLIALGDCRKRSYQMTPAVRRRRDVRLASSASGSIASQGSASATPKAGVKTSQMVCKLTEIA